VIGAGAAVYSANKQSSAAKNAQNIAQQQQQQNISLEQPYNQAGQGALKQLQYLEGLGPQQGATAGTLPDGVSAGNGGFGSLNAPFTADTFQKYSPAYQFVRQQGDQGVINQDAGAQGALSGSAMKDLLSFNSGLANESFNNAFGQYQTQQMNTFNRLNSIAGLGQAAASGQAAVNTNLAGTAGQAAQNIGTAQAGGIVGAANSLGSGATNAALWAQYGGGGFVPMNSPALSGGTAGWGAGAEGVPLNLPPAPVP
ncbi:MAG TPA: hypothetical protein VH724_09850, partial [Candidatus Angelobacter sp.]|nr:hypothetical protein [Candidatus Angelobacter sp.]